MVINVDDWVETNTGEIVLVVALPHRGVKTLEVYDPVEQVSRQLEVASIRRGFGGGLTS